MIFAAILKSANGNAANQIVAISDLRDRVVQGGLDRGAHGWRRQHVQNYRWRNPRGDLLLQPMTLANTKPLRFSPQGLSDALAEEDAFPGACTSLQNLIPDPSTKNLWTPRPAAVSLTTFGSFSSPTGVVVTKIVGSFVYGLVSTSRFAGKDEPFCFNLATNAFVTVTGISSGNVPTTQPTTGDWTPPTMDVMGTQLVVTHPGFDGVTNFIGWFDITILTAPVWHAGNFLLQNVVTTLALTSGGTGYTNGTYPGVALSYIVNGPGAGATANITVAGGIVTVATLAMGGVGYDIGDQLTSIGMVLGAGGAGLVLTVTAVSGAGISVMTLVNGGTSYPATGTITNVPLTGGSGSGATGNFVTNGAGNITSVTVNTPGWGINRGINCLLAASFEPCHLRQDPDTTMGSSPILRRLGEPVKACSST